MSTLRRKKPQPGVEFLEGRMLLSAVPSALKSKAPVVELLRADTLAAKTTGVHANQLVGTVTALSVKNTTKGVINYQLRWTSSSPWVSYSVKPGVTRSHYASTPLSSPLAKPTIRFDKSFSAGYQEQVYGLTTKFENEHARDNFYLGKQYLFKPVTNGVNLYAKA